MSAGDPVAGSSPAAWREDLRRLDLAVYAAIAATPTPTLDPAFRRLSSAADHSRLWLVSAALLAALGGAPGRRAAANGLASIALTSPTVNLVLKPFGGRRRPSRDTHHVPVARQVAMPESTSFPSGHAASAFAFASGASYALPAVGFPLNAAAALVAYSRVHTGVHYPADVIAGSITGAALAPVAVALRHRLRHPDRRRPTRGPAAARKRGLRGAAR
jgi:membrane-associated phospholipid phosphatase